MITVNLYYTGINGNARKFAEEMEKSGTADMIRAERFVSDDLPSVDEGFIRQ